MKREKLASSHRGPRLWEPWRAFEDFEDLGNHRVGAEKDEANIDPRRPLHSCRRTNKQEQNHWKFGAKPDSIASNTPIRAIHSKWIYQKKTFWLQLKSSNYHILHIQQYEAHWIHNILTFLKFQVYQVSKFWIPSKMLSISLIHWITLNISGSVSVSVVIVVMSL